GWAGSSTTLPGGITAADGAFPLGELAAGLLGPGGAVVGVRLVPGGTAWLCWELGLLSPALRTSAPARVAPARIATAAAMPMKRTGPCGIRGFCTNVTYRSADRSVPAVALMVRVRRAS